MRSFYGLLKEAQYIVDSQEAREVFNPDPQQGPKEQGLGIKAIERENSREEDTYDRGLIAIAPSTLSRPPLRDW